ncbi:MAG: aspartate aminotransferase family protein [Mesorhizobium sp.]
MVTDNAYHGVTAVTSAFSPSLGSGVDLAPHVRTVTPPVSGANGANAGAMLAQEVAKAAADLKRHGIRPAMLIVDTIFSSDGVIADPANFLAPAVDAIREAGGLFVADEVQPGFGRTGEAMWGFQRHGVVPDMVTIGKPMGNGYPMGGLIAKPQIIEGFGRKARYFNTFGGNPVAASTGQAVLDVIERDHLIANAKDVGNYLKAGVETVARNSSLAGEVRGAGLFIGVDIVEDGVPSADTATRIVNEMRKRRVLISASGLHGNVLKIRPPLVFSKDNTDHFIGVFEQALLSV